MDGMYGVRADGASYEAHRAAALTQKQDVEKTMEEVVQSLQQCRDELVRGDSADLDRGKQEVMCTINVLEELSTRTRQALPSNYQATMTECTVLLAEYNRAIKERQMHVSVVSTARVGRAACTDVTNTHREVVPVRSFTKTTGFRTFAPPTISVASPSSSQGSSLQTFGGTSSFSSTTALQPKPIRPVSAPSGNPGSSPLQFNWGSTNFFMGRASPQIVHQITPVPRSWTEKRGFTSGNSFATPVDRGSAFVSSSSFGGGSPSSSHFLSGSSQRSPISFAEAAAKAAQERALKAQNAHFEQQLSEMESALPTHDQATLVQITSALEEMATQFERGSEFHARATKIMDTVGVCENEIVQKLVAIEEALKGVEQRLGEINREEEHRGYLAECASVLEELHTNGIPHEGLLANWQDLYTRVVYQISEIDYLSFQERVENRIAGEEIVPGLVKEMQGALKLVEDALILSDAKEEIKKVYTTLIARYKAHIIKVARAAKQEYNKTGNLEESGYKALLHFYQTCTPDDPEVHYVERIILNN